MSSIGEVSGWWGYTEAFALNPEQYEHNTVILTLLSAKLCPGNSFIPKLN